MGMVKEQSARGLKIVLDGVHIKTTPSRYKRVIRIKHILNPKRKRLIKEERFLLEVAIYEKALKQHQPLVYEKVKRSSPKNVRLVYPPDGPRFYLLTYNNQIKIRCPKQIYDVGYNRLAPLY
ncbi:MAG: hypothetical protein AAF634_05015 [Bacteroidota bacterium]